MKELLLRLIIRKYFKSKKSKTDINNLKNIYIVNFGHEYRITLVLTPQGMIEINLDDFQLYLDGLENNISVKTLNVYC